jgi:hypothetical protein
LQCSRDGDNCNGVNSNSSHYDNNSCNQNDSNDSNTTAIRDKITMATVIMLSHISDGLQRLQQQLRWRLFHQHQQRSNRHHNLSECDNNDDPVVDRLVPWQITMAPTAATLAMPNVVMIATITAMATAAVTGITVLTTMIAAANCIGENSSNNCNIIDGDRCCINCNGRNCDHYRVERG